MSIRTPAAGTPALRRAGRVFKAVVAIAVMASLAACSTRGGKIPYEVANFGPPDRVASTEATYDVPLGPLDVIRISVFQVPDLSAEYQVDARGNLDLPLVGTVSVRDQSVDQLATSLERLYGQRYLNNPDISARLITSANRNITVEGGVKSSGIFSLTSRTTLVGAIALAGGINTQEGNAKRIAIFRKRDGRTVAAAFDLVAIRHGEMEDPIVYPGDTVVVDGDGLRGAYRELLQVIPLIAVFSQL